MTTQLAYTRTTGKNFDATVAAIEQATAANGFRVLHIHDVRQTLADKGFDLAPYKIIEVCNARFAHAVLSIDRSVGMMLPCRVVVHQMGDQVEVLLLKPSIIAEMMPDVPLGSIPHEVETILVRIVDEALA